MKFLVIFLVILSVFNMILVDARIDLSLYPPKRENNPIIIGKSPATYKAERAEFLRQQQQRQQIVIGGKQEPIANVKLAGY